MSLKIKDFIFCDDIRSEFGNKFSLMGIYGDRIKVNVKSEAPKVVKLPISLMLRFLQEGLEQKDYNFDLKIVFADKELATMQGTFSSGSSPVISIPLAKIDFMFESSGELNFDFAIKHGDVAELEFSAKIYIEIVRPNQP